MAESVDGTPAEHTAALSDLETLQRQLPALGHTLLNALAEVPAEELGETSLAAALATLLRISRTGGPPAGRRSQRSGAALLDDR